MASLNTLRTKFGVVLSIIIAGALLAFIFSLKTEMGFSGNDPKVGVINGKKINHSEFYDEYEKIKSQRQVQESDEQQSAMLANATWQTLMGKYVLQPGFDKLGIGVTEPERTAIFRGEVPTQTFYSQFVNQRTGEYDLTGVLNLVSQAQSNAQADQVWGMLNEQAKTERELMKYVALLGQGVYINSLEIDNGLNAANNNYSGQWTGKKYAEVSDSLFTVSSSEVKAFYKDHKKMFKQVPSRALSYVVFEVTPTDDDMLALEKTVNEVGAEFVATNELKSFVRANRNGRIADNYVAAAQLPEGEAKALLAGEAYGPVLKNNEWTMSRVLDTKLVPDTLGLRHIVLSFTEDARADSLLKVIKAGGDFAQLAAQYSGYDATAANGGDLGLIPFSVLSEEFSTPLTGAKKGDVVKIATSDVIQLIQVYRADTPTKHYQVASITYPVEASKATRGVAHNLAGSFTVSAKGSLEAFDEAASQNALTPRVATVSQGERTIRGLEDSRDIARWAYDAKVGDVSEIFTVGKDYVVATLTGIDDAEYAPINHVSPQISQRLLLDKKFDYISKQISGTTLAEEAASLGSEVGDFENVSYSAYYLEGPGLEPRLIGAITTTTDKGVVSTPVKGMSGVYVFQVNDEQVGDSQTADDVRVRLQATNENMVQQYSMAAIQEMANIQDLSGKFF